MKIIKNFRSNLFVFIIIFIPFKFQYTYNMGKNETSLTNQLCSLMLSDTDESIKKIEKLLNANPDIINTTNCGNGNRPLSIAVKNSRNKIVKFLLNYGKTKGIWLFSKTYKVVDINLPNNSGDRPIIIALKNKNFEAFDLLLANPGINLNFHNKASNNILHELLMLDLENKHKKQLIEEIINKYKQKYKQQNLKSLVNYQNSDGNTPLHIAAEKGYFDIYDLLKNNGALESIANLSGQTPKDIRFILEKERDKFQKKFKKISSKKSKIFILDLIKFQNSMAFLNAYYKKKH